MIWISCCGIGVRLLINLIIIQVIAVLVISLWISMDDITIMPGVLYSLNDGDEHHVYTQISYLS